MRLLISHKINGELLLPINYHHILQGIIYRNMGTVHDYSEYIHDKGFAYGNRNFKLFTYSLLQGRYEVRGKNIAFRNEVCFEVSCPEMFMIRTLAEGIAKNGISYGRQHFPEVELYLSDETIEEDSVLVRMLSPITVYSTNIDTGKTYFYAPRDELFNQMVNENFLRKYQACYGIKPDSDIQIEPVKIMPKDKYITRYKDFYICGWMGEYRLSGKRKYLDFLYQTGLGSKNSQGFGMVCMIK